MSSIHDLATWKPLLRLVRASHEERLAAPGGYLTGRISLGSWSVPVQRPRLVPGRVEAAAHPELEVLCIGWRKGEPVSLAPVVGLPRLRTLTAIPGALADPLEIAGLTGLEYLSLGPEEWRVLLDAGAVPRSLSAAGIEVQGEQPPLPILDLANELLALWGRPLIGRTVLDAGR